MSQRIQAFCRHPPKKDLSIQSKMRRNHFIIKKVNKKAFEKET